MAWPGLAGRGPLVWVLFLILSTTTGQQCPLPGHSVSVCGPSIDHIITTVSMLLYHHTPHQGTTAPLSLTAAAPNNFPDTELSSARLGQSQPALTDKLVTSSPPHCCPACSAAAPDPARPRLRSHPTSIDISQPQPPPPALTTAHYSDLPLTALGRWDLSFFLSLSEFYQVG